MSIVNFCEKIINEPNEAFPSGKDSTYNYSDDLINYLKIFFYENLNVNEEIKKCTFSDENLLKLRVNTYCYLMGAKNFDYRELLNRFSLVNKIIKKEEEVENLEFDEEQESTENGEYSKEDENLESREELESLELNTDVERALTPYIDDITQRWEVLNRFFEIYLEELKIIYLKNKIEKIIIYEAPPYSGINKIDHFFLTGGNYLNCFSFDSAGEKRVITKEEEINSLSNSIFKLFSLKKGKKYSKIDEGKSQKKINDITSNFDSAINSAIVYIDLMIIPFPFTSAIRKNWSKDKKYEINEKKLPVLLLEWAIERFKKKMNKADLFSSNCKIALGTPLLTSVSIFEYYSDKLFELDNSIKVDLSRINSPMAFKKMECNATIFPLFKSNVVGASKYPEQDLVKNAFNILDKK